MQQVPQNIGYVHLLEISYHFKMQGIMLNVSLHGKLLPPVIPLITRQSVVKPNI